MYYSDDVIQEVMDANDIEDVVGSYVRLKRSGRGAVGLCPFHNEKTPSFHVSSDKQLYHCFGCGEGGTVINFIMKAENLDFTEALKFLADRANITLPEPDMNAAGAEKTKKRSRMISANAFAAKFFYETLVSKKEGREGLEYIKKRNFTPKTVTSFGIGYAPDSYDSLIKYMEKAGYKKEELYEFGLAVMRGSHYIDKFRKRVMFPIIDVRGNVIGFGGRVLDDSKPKYLNSPETDVFNKRLNLFALNFAKNKKESNLILVEGFADVISLHQAGIINTVATLGTALTEEQARLIKKYASEAVICYDTDEAGVKATMRAIEIFASCSLRAKVLSLSGAKDPDEFINKNGPAAFKEAVKKAIPATQYKIDMARKKYDVEGNIDDKVKFLNEAASILYATHNPVEIDTYADALASKYNIKKESVYSEIKRLGGRERKSEQRSISRSPANAIRAEKRGESVRKIRLSASEIKEKSLLYLMFSNKSVSKKTESRIGTSFFSSDVHRRLASIISQIWDTGVAPDSAAVLKHFDGDEAKYVTAVLLDESVYSDANAAADGLTDDIIRLNIDKRILEEQSKENPDAVLIMKLMTMRNKAVIPEGGTPNE